MKLSAIALIVSTVALACGLYVAVEVSRLRDELGRQRQPRERVAVAVEPAGIAPVGPPAGERFPAREEPARTDPGAAPVAPARAATLEERVTRLEKDQEEMREASRSLSAMPFRGRTFARTVDDLSRTLELTPTQKARVEQAVERGKRQIEEILKIPDETGKSPFERREERRKKMMAAVENKDAGGLIAFASDMFAHRDRPIPGRNATYGEEIGRVKRETRDEIAATLGVEQRKAFEDTDIDPLLGEGGAMAFSVIHKTTGDGEEADGAVIAESIEIDVEADGKDGKDG